MNEDDPAALDPIDEAELAVAGYHGDHLANFLRPYVVRVLGPLFRKFYNRKKYSEEDMCVVALYIGVQNQVDPAEVYEEMQNDVETVDFTVDDINEIITTTAESYAMALASAWATTLISLFEKKIPIEMLDEAMLPDPAIANNLFTEASKIFFSFGVAIIFARNILIMARSELAKGEYLPVPLIELLRLNEMELVVEKGN